jgi:predicted RNA-binding Zn-ribbon protein involved in translation (DUF1610 family)
MAAHFLRTAHPGAVLAGIGVVIAVPLWAIDGYVGGTPILSFAKWTPAILILIGIYVLFTQQNKWNLVYNCPRCDWRGPLKQLVPVPDTTSSFACPGCGDIAGERRDPQGDGTEADVSLEAQHDASPDGRGDA